MNRHNESPIRQARVAILDKMPLTPDEKLFALEEFCRMWEAFCDSEPVARARKAGVDPRVFSGALAMLTHCYETIFWESDKEAREQVERKYRDQQPPDVG